MDGLKGPVLSGTGLYMKRVSLLGNYEVKGIIKQEDLFSFF